MNLTIRDGNRRPGNFRWKRKWERKHTGERGGEHLTLDFDVGYSHKLGIGAKFDSGFDVGLLSTQLWNTSGTNRPDSFANTYPLDTSFEQYVTQFDPAAAKGSAIHQTYFWNIDLETGYTFKFSGGSIRFNGGIRYAEYSQNYDEKRTNEWLGFYDDGENRYQAERILDLNIKGVGPRIGVSFNVPMASTESFNIFGSFNYSWLMSKRNINDQANNIILIWPAGYLPGASEVTTGGTPTWYSDGGYKEKNKDIRIDVMEFEFGVEYLLKVGKKSSILFALGYRHDTHFNAMTNCGYSKVVLFANEEIPQPRRVFGKCKIHFHDPRAEHSVHHLSQDFVTHGPFLRATLGF